MASSEKTGKVKFFVGQPRPNEALLGRVDKDMSTILGVTEQCQPIGGMSIIPNRSIVWGIRLDSNGKRPPEMLQANDKKYTGKVDFNVAWGTPGGIPITTRYKSGSSSIDYDYQVLQMGMPKFENDLENNYLTLPFGENVIFDSEEAKQTMLATHHENIDSICRNPDTMNGSLRLVKTFESNKEQIKTIDKEFEAVKIVRAATTFEHLRVLKTIIGDKTEIRYDESDEQALFENILIWVKMNAHTFLDLVKAYDVRVSDIIERFRSYKAYDLTTNGTIRVGQDKKEVVLEGIDAKGDDMLQYLFDARMEPEVFDAVNRMIILAQKLK